MSPALAPPAIPAICPYCDRIVDGAHGHVATSTALGVLIGCPDFPTDMPQGVIVFIVLPRIALAMALATLVPPVATGPRQDVPPALSPTRIPRPPTGSS